MKLFKDTTHYYCDRCRWAHKALMTGLCVSVAGIMGTITLFKFQKQEYAKTAESFANMLEESVEMERALWAAGAGRWSWNLENNNLCWDDQMHSIFGTDSVQWSHAYDEWLKVVHPEDANHVNTIVQECVNGEKDRYSVIYRIILPNKQERFIRAYGKLSENKKFMSGICIEVSPHDYEPPNIVQDVMNAAGWAVVVANKNHRIIHWDTAAESIFGYTKKDALTMSVEQLMKQKVRGAHFAAYSQGLAEGDGHFHEIECIDAITKNKENIKLHLTVIVPKGEDRALAIFRLLDGDN
ncbi:MAG: PAS domain-containing protein [Bacteroidetes bacterium]|nr:MAG: PAS domain-containing protein [Bacteroidota bacterium]